MMRHTRPVTKLLILGGFLTLVLTLYSLHPSSTRLRQSVSGVFSFRERTPCSPELWSYGQWTRREPPRTTKTNASSVADVLEFHGFEGCAADREYKWHLGADDSELYRYPDVSSYQWTPPSRCDARPFKKEEVVQDLVENGGWFLVGDSVTENHFFSLSCMLYPHVIATPNYTENPYFDRAWPQNLYLNPESPLVHKLHPPLGFNISLTPLVTFRRVDLLLTEEQLSDLYRTHNPTKAQSENFRLMGGDQAWEIPPSEYLSIFTAPLPEANYGTMVVSTAGHWTVTTFPGLKDDSMRKQGIDNVLNFFRDVTKVWASMVQSFLKGAEYNADRRQGGGLYTKGGRRRQVVVRSYLPGHDNCHNIFHPWTWYEQGGQDLSYNWGQIRDFNREFEQTLSSRNEYPDIHYLGIDMPALLRPDAHAGGDCLHLMTGTGVLEGWSEYIFHFTTRELGSWVR